MPSLEQILCRGRFLSCDRRSAPSEAVPERLRAQAGELPPSRKFGREQIEAWIKEDEEGMRRFREGR